MHEQPSVEVSRKSAAWRDALPRVPLILIAWAVCSALILVSPLAAAPIQPSACAQAAKYSEARHGTSLLVVQNGQTVFEHYANGGKEDAAWPIFSGTKNFWGIAALVAISQGRLHLDDFVSETITEWRGDPRKSKITVRQLLTFTDGLEPASFLHRSSIADRNAMALKVSSVAQPGVAFTYGPSHLQVFCELLRRKLNGGSTFAYLQEHVLSPLGIGSIPYKQDARGNPLFATGFQLSARQWIRLGQMILAHGSSNGHQIVPADLLQQAFVGTRANPSYGLTFWLNRPAGFLSGETDIEKRLDLPWQRASWRGVCISKTAPTDMIAAIGSHYQRMFMIPSMNALIVRQSSADAKFSDGEFLRLILKPR
jgi:CubicO group peptidase (beta-lactamase class C family)